MIGPTAFLIYSNQLYFSEASTDLSDTPITRLIEAVWDHLPNQAFHLLRCRIYTNYPLTSRCRGAIKLAAKRVSMLEPTEFEKLFYSYKNRVKLIPTGAREIRILTGEALPDPDHFLKWFNSYTFTSQNRPILAALLDPQNKVVLAAENMSSDNRLLHAEVNLIREYVRRTGTKVPAGYRVWVSLKPCCMCGGFIGELCEDGFSTSVTYLKDDPGPKARTTPLTQMKLFQE